jgi:tripartite-type tricarboxylate transporter receptor subunit TctC
MKRRALLAVTAIAALLSTGARTAWAQAYPSRPITIIEPIGISSVPDIVIRVMAPRVAEVLRQPVVVENVVGAGGQIGANRVAHAAPDGYHLVIGGISSHAYSQTLFKDPLYNAATDFAPVILLTEQPLMLVTSRNLPVTDLQRFVAYTKSNQANMKYGALAGTGTTNHIVCALFNNVIGVSVTEVPYRPPSATAYQDLIAGRIDYVCPVATGDAKAHIDSGDFRGIAVFARHRSPILPDVATADEQGLKDFEGMQWNAILAPKGTPAAIVQKLNAVFSDAMDTADVRSRIAAYGAELIDPERRSPEYLQKFLRSEIERWAGPIKAAGAAGQ